MNYLIAVYPNRLQALSAFTALEKESLPREQISILGEGYKTADDYGIIQPNLQSKNNVKRLAYWLVPCGFIAGFTLIFFTNIEIITASNAINWITGGLLGAFFGLLTTFGLGRNVKSAAVNKDAWLYRQRLNSGKYLIFFHGTEELVNKATSILHSFQGEDVLV
ncbi:MAG: hypothetical protein AAGG00_04550 [Cyanobacteria bacterium P01_H01_bin.150]|mgnify:CR=1 FL=1